MPESVLRIRILLASPGNLSKDRGKVFDIVRQINLDSGQRDGFIAEVVSWETHSRPAAGEYAQSVINEQFPEDIDIFLGMMGTYFGTPTKHWGSGTEEEFRLAYDRWKQKKSPEIMFYFSDALTSIRQIDPEQLEKRNSFQKEIATLGIYYFIYTDIVEFQFDLHNHISAAIHVVLNRKNTCKKEDVIPEESASSLMAYNELLKDDPIVNAVSLIGRSAAHMEEYSKILVGLNSDISRLSRAAIKEAKHIKNAVETKNEIKIIKSIGKVTDEMSLYSKGLIKKIPTLSEEFSESIMLILRASKIVKENDLRDAVPLSGIGSIIKSSRQSLISLVDSIKAVEDGFSGWPDDILDLKIQKEILLALHYDLSASLKRSIELLDKLYNEVNHEAPCPAQV